ncbi:MAG: hypothetical protein JWN37_674 [Candidatus Nomurabacteria bacterium]|nr:hypothetical protein [Candidatus Nomurabacteria bacterium]
MKKDEYLINKGVNRWMVFFTIVFIIITSLFYYILYTENKLPTSITIWDFVILALATFRLVRLFVYDAIFKFIQENLMDAIEIMDNGELLMTHTLAQSSLKRTLYKLAVCPWCMGVWIALCGAFVYYLLPGSYFLFVVLAISSFASMLQVFSNLIGWSAEYRKLKAEKFV